MLDAGLARRTVTAWFTDLTFEEVLTAVCRVVDAPCTVAEDGAVIGEARS